MAVTVANIITNVDTYFGDNSTDRISQAERLQAITESTVWLLEELGNDHAIKTYELDYLDTINYYKVTNSLSSLLASADLRRPLRDHTVSAVHKSSKEIAEEIGRGHDTFAWAIERRNDDTYLAINLDLGGMNKKAKIVSDFDSVSAGGGTWEADTSASDALNVAADTVEYKYGSGSLNFDIDVSQSVNNRATIFNESLTTMSLSEFEDTGSWLFELYVPDVSEFTSVTLYWGNDSSNYWSATVTTDIDGAALTDGWNTIKVDWSDSTSTGTPSVSAVDYVRFDINYGAGQTDDTDYRIDYLRIARPEKLTYHYVSFDVGESAGGTTLQAFTATSDVPFFSGKYDQYKYAVAHKAAAILFYAVRLREEAQFEEREAQRALERQRDIFPSSKSKESHDFKPDGINFNRTSRRRYSR